MIRVSRQSRGHVHQTPRAFSPLDIPNLAAWYRADMGITLNGATVSAWADQSGNARHMTQATAGKQPTYTAVGINGRPSVTFTAGSATAMATAAAIHTGSEARTIIAVYQPTVIGAVAYAIAGQSGGAVNDTWFLLMSRTNGAVGDPYAATYFTDLTGPAQSVTAKIGMMAYAGGANGLLSLFKNGTLANSGVRNLNTNNVPFAIGADGPPTLNVDCLTGHISEVIVVSRDLTSLPENRRTHRYLNALYGIAVAA